MNQLKTDAYVNVEHIPSCSNRDVNDVSRFRNSTDTVSQRVLESVDDELHRQFDEDTWFIRLPNSEEFLPAWDLVGSRFLVLALIRAPNFRSSAPITETL